jgi:hypothetical protein
MNPPVPPDNPPAGDDVRRAVAFARRLRAAGRPRLGRPADKAFFDDLSEPGPTRFSETDIEPA